MPCLWPLLVNMYSTYIYIWKYVVDCPSMGPCIRCAAANVCLNVWSVGHSGFESGSGSSHLKSDAVTTW